MAKIADRVEKMGQTATGIYKNVENFAVNSYQAVERGAVDGFARACDKCIDVLFAKEGETVAEAKERLKNGK